MKVGTSSCDMPDCSWTGARCIEGVLSAEHTGAGTHTRQAGHGFLRAHRSGTRTRTRTRNILINAITSSLQPVAGSGPRGSTLYAHRNVANGGAAPMEKYRGRCAPTIPGRVSRAFSTLCSNDSCPRLPSNAHLGRPRSTHSYANGYLCQFFFFTRSIVPLLLLLFLFFFFYLITKKFF